jgi:hypothetical protein
LSVFQRTTSGAFSTRGSRSIQRTNSSRRSA